MSTVLPAFEHEQLHVRQGTRSDLVVAVAIHSTALGPAIGGCRIWNYPHWADAVADVMRLSSAMSLKNAAAGLPRGGGKSVICIPEGVQLSPEERRAAVLDLGDLIEELGGQYATGQDVGSSMDDMRVLHERTQHILGLPTDLGGPGGTAEPTAIGVFECIKATAARLRGTSDLTAARIVVSGLGNVGARLAELLTEAGATLHLSDIDRSKKNIADALGATWVEPEEAHRIEADIYVPAGVGGTLTSTVIGELASKAVVGPANNPLAEPAGADHLAQRGILYAPDFIVNAGGSVFLTLMNEPGADEHEVHRRVRAIGSSLEEIYSRAVAENSTPLNAARSVALERIRFQKTEFASQS